MNVTKYDILVVRINNTETLVDSKPCSMCIKMMKDYGIRKVYYSNADSTITEQKVADMIPEHVSFATTKAIEHMSRRNIYLIFGMNIDIITIQKQRIVHDNG